MTSRASGLRAAALPALALALSLAAGAAAQQQPAATTDSTGLFARPVDTATLSAHRGGNQFVHNEMTLTGTTADNTARDVTTGSNAIGTGAFANMSGLPIVIQNSGANVLIQNAVILHLQLD